MVIYCFCSDCEFFNKPYKIIERKKRERKKGGERKREESEKRTVVGVRKRGRGKNYYNRD